MPLFWGTECLLVPPLSKCKSLVFCYTSLPLFQDLPLPCSSGRLPETLQRSIRSSLQHLWEALTSPEWHATNLTSNGTVPWACSSSSGATIPTSPTRFHPERMNFTLQHFTLKEIQFWMALFSWWIGGIKRIRNLSAGACLPRSHQTVNLMTARESDSLAIKPSQFWINTELWSQGQKVDWRVKFKLITPETLCNMALLTLSITI